MIIFNLTCSNEHNFEGWFASKEDFEKQNKQKQISCPKCSSTTIKKCMSAPYVRTKSSSSKQATIPNNNRVENDELYDNLRKKIIDHVLNTTEDVGEKFPEEARKIHYNEKPARPIRGNASRNDVEELNEEGIEVLPIPGLTTPPETPH